MFRLSQTTSFFFFVILVVVVSSQGESKPDTSTEAKEEAVTTDTPNSKGTDGNSSEVKDPAESKDSTEAKDETKDAKPKDATPKDATPKDVTPKDAEKSKGPTGNEEASPKLVDKAEGDVKKSLEEKGNSNNQKDDKQITTPPSSPKSANGKNGTSRNGSSNIFASVFVTYLGLVVFFV